MTVRPPRLANWLLRRCVKELLLEEIEGDLQEKFLLKLKKKGPFRAQINYWYQVLHYLRPFALKGVQIKNPTFMLIKHNFIISLRTFRRYKGTFLINLLSLTSGLVSCLLIALWMSSEWRMDKFHLKDDQLFRVIAQQKFESHDLITESTPVPLAEALQSAIPGIRRTVSVQEDWFRKQAGYIGSSNRVKKLKAAEQYIQGPFFEMFSYKLLRGDLKNPLPSKRHILLSDETARKLFPHDDPMGKLVSWDQEGTAGDFVVSGIFKQPGKYSSMKFDVLLPLEARVSTDSLFGQWNNAPVTTYLELEKGVDVTAINDQIRDFTLSKQSEPIQLSTQRFSDLYLQDLPGQAANKSKTLSLFGGVALFMLLIASINFMNLTTAKAYHRLKEIGVKKALGARKTDLILQYLTENILSAIFSFFISLVIAAGLLPFFNTITAKDMTLIDEPALLGGFFAVTFITGLAAGAYPAFYLSSFRPMEVLRGKLNTGSPDTFFRRGLVLFQFALSTIIIFGIFVVHGQVKWIANKDLGVSKGNILLFAYDAGSAQGYQALLQELRQIPEVVSVSGYTHDMTGNYGLTDDLLWEGKNPTSDQFFVTLEGGFDYLETLGVELKDGRHFNRDTDGQDTKIIFNQAAIQAMGLENPIGQSVNLWGKQREIIGIAEDFHFASLREGITPCFIRVNPNLDKTMVKFAEGADVAVRIAIEQALAARHPELPFEYSFLDQQFDALYASEATTLVLMRNFGVLSIFISCLGLLGLTAFSTERRSKELSIRRVLGSGNLGIYLLLSKDFTKVILLSLLLSLPVGYHFAARWLENFSSAIEISALQLGGTMAVVLCITWITIAIQTADALRSSPISKLNRD